MSVANHEAQSWRVSAGTRRSQRLLVFVPLLALGGGAALAWSGHLRVAQFLWAAGTAPVLLALMISAASVYRAAQSGSTSLPRWRWEVRLSAASISPSSSLP
jgi:hypothetical protein